MFGFATILDKLELRCVIFKNYPKNDFEKKY